MYILLLYILLLYDVYICFILYMLILVDVSYNWKKVWISENLYDFMILFYEG